MNKSIKLYTVHLSDIIRYALYTYHDKIHDLLASKRTTESINDVHDALTEISSLIQCINNKSSYKFEEFCKHKDWRIFFPKDIIDDIEECTRNVYIVILDNLVEEGVVPKVFTTISHIHLKQFSEEVK